MTGVETVLLLKDGNRIDSYFYPPKSETTLKHILKLNNLEYLLNNDPREISIPARNQASQTVDEEAS